MPLKQRQYTPGKRGPLDGVRVLDLSRLVAGNTLTGLLADFGAEVVKVEPAAGDTLRAWRTKDVQTNWKLYARNKKSVAFELRKPEARELLLKMVEKADVFVESFRPDTLEKMGLAPDVLLARNPRLVIVRISGWGQTGPYRRRPGFGTLVEGISGFASLYGASGVLVALREVEVNGGKGQVIDLPLLDPLFHVLGPQAANYRLTGKVKPRTGSRSTNSGPRNAYRTKDGHFVALSASTQKMAERTFTAIGRGDLIDDPRYRTNADRLKNFEELDAIIGEFIAQRTQAENVAFFEKAEVTIGPIYDITQILEDPHFIDREVVADYPDPDMQAFPMHHVVPRLEGTPGSIRTPSPKLGQHNRELLREAGVDDVKYAALLRGGIVYEGEAASAPEDE
jgi:formyl-CoA transferase